MSREIKFRIFAATDDGLEMIYLSELDCDNGLWFESHKHIDEYSETIMQYTGLKDKNGKDIYEGDLVNCNRYENEENYILEIKDIRYLPSELSGSNLNWKEVIGNVYQNTELRTPKN